MTIIQTIRIAVFKCARRRLRADALQRLHPGQRTTVTATMERWGPAPDGIASEIVRLRVGSWALRSCEPKDVPQIVDDLGRWDDRSSRFT